MSLRPKYVDFDKTWKSLQKTLTHVLTFKTVSRDVWNDSFNDIYSLCIAYPEPLADRLYDETKYFFEKWTNEYYSILFQKENHEFLEAYSDEWNIFSDGVRYIDLLYRYLNLQHIKRNKNKSADCSYTSLDFSDNDDMKEIRILALEVWKRNIIVPMKEKIIQLMLRQIEYIRTNEVSCEERSPMSLSHIKNTANSLIEVEVSDNSNNTQLYADVFEKELLSATGTHYAIESARLLQENDISDYLKKVLQQLELESKRALVLFPVSQKKVLEECRIHLIKNHLSILNSEAKNIVKDRRHSDLQNLYVLLKPIKEGLVELLKYFQENVECDGSRPWSNLNDPNMVEEFVENILNIREKYIKIIVDILQSDTAFIGALDKACGTIAKQNSKELSVLPSELLARYCDLLLKKISKSLSEYEIETKLDNIITVFKYVEDKDMFQKLYAKYLGKRLIYQQSNSMDLEEALINRLRSVCGFEFTNKFHRMFTDITVSDDLYQEFINSFQKASGNLSFNFNVNVLTQGSWPITINNHSNSLDLPIEIEQSMQRYEKFYFSKFQGRKLTWVHHMSTVDIQFSYLPKVYFVTMNVHQMVILMLFQQSNALDYQELVNDSKLSEEQLKKYIQIFLSFKILVSKNDSIMYDSKIMLNLHFSCKKTKFRIPASNSIDANEVEQISKIVDDDRKMYIQATIVRVMKCRKILEHSELIGEVLNQSKARFKPSIPTIKKCIECLIDKAYLERVANSTSKYSYVA